MDESGAGGLSAESGGRGAGRGGWHFRQCEQYTGGIRGWMGLGKLPWEIRVSPGGHGWPGERHQVLVLCHYLDTLTTIYPHLPATHISAEASQKSREWEFIDPACSDPHKANTPHTIPGPRKASLHPGSSTTQTVFMVNCFDPDMKHNIYF